MLCAPLSLSVHRIGLPKREIVIDDEKEPLPEPKINDRRWPIPARTSKHASKGWVLGQLTCEHIEVVMEIQAKCFEPIHCEEKQVNRLIPHNSVLLSKDSMILVGVC